MSRKSKSRRDKKKQKKSQAGNKPAPTTPKEQLLSFTTRAQKGFLGSLVNQVHIMPVSADGTVHPPNGAPLRAVWDTGASHSTVTQRVVDDYGLIQTGRARTQTANGPSDVNTYLVDLFLPNKVAITGLRVNDMTTIEGTDMLIGMDVISQGDFSVTNCSGDTWFSFRMPSVQHVDYTKWIMRGNQRCSCGSGEYYAKCCGKPFF